MDKPPQASVSRQRTCGSMNYVQQLTKGQIKTTTNKLKNRKSSGSDKITNKMLKYVADELMTDYHTFTVRLCLQEKYSRNKNLAL